MFMKIMLFFKEPREYFQLPRKLFQKNHILPAIRMQWLFSHAIFHRGQQLRESRFRQMHLLPGILREHFAAVRSNQSLEYFATIFLCGLDFAALQLGDPAAALWACGYLDSWHVVAGGHVEIWLLWSACVSTDKYIY